MKKYNKKYNALFLILFSCFQVNSQTAEQAYQFAEKQFIEKNYSLALKEYQRALLFDTAGNYADLTYKIAESHHILGNYTQALNYYDISYALAKTDSAKFEIVFKKSSAYILNGNYQYALIELFNLDDSINITFQIRKNFYLAVSYFGLEDYNKSHDYFIKCFSEQDSLSEKRINEIFTKKKYLNRPNPKTSKILSMIAPGLGQLYAGDIKNSLNSFFLTVGLLSLGINIAISYKPLDAFLAVFPWFQRYHQGGYMHAEEIAKNKRSQKRNDAFKEILQLIDNKSKVN